MDSDTQAIVVGLSAGFGGFVGLLILGCICWNICCGSWCEKKTIQSTIVPVKNQQRTTTATKMQNNLSTITSTRSTTKSSASKDLANTIQSSHR